MADRKPLVLGAGEKSQMQPGDRLIDGDSIPIRNELAPFYLEYTIDTSTTVDSDPGAGTMRFDQATQNTTTTLRADLLDWHGASATTLLGFMTDNFALGTLRLYKTQDPTKWIEFVQTGVDLSPPAGYRNILVQVTGYSEANPFTNVDILTLAFMPRWVTSLTKNIDLAGVITPSQITSNQNDYAPTGFSTASTLLINSDATRTITGLAGGTPGKVILIHNTGSFAISLSHNSGSSSAANRFKFRGGNAFSLAADGMVLLQYDFTATKWRAVAGSDVDPLAGALNLTGIISPTAITANTDNWAPTGFSTASFIRISATGGTWNLTGIAGGSDGKFLLVHNVGALNIVFKHNVTSTAANRFTLPLASDALIAPDMMFLLQYDNTTQRWRVMGSSNFSAVVASSLALTNSSNDPLSIVSSLNTTFGRIQSNLASSLSAGNDIMIGLGRDNSTNNMGYMMYLYAGAASANNCLAFGFWGNDKRMRIYPSAGVFIGNSSPADPGTAALQTEGKMIAGAAIRLKSFATVATLPAATAGDTAFVLDALTPVWGAAVVGGGAIKVPVYYDGAWKVG